MVVSLVNVPLVAVPLVVDSQIARVDDERRVVLLRDGVSFRRDCHFLDSEARQRVLILEYKKREIYLMKINHKKLSILSNFYCSFK
jgi:hypothetical protein